ncbi:MAG: response regulator [Promethearchaeota archaeon]|nr:MAG: response regulator [Candidatus Lokiarchaeota archaeon]
MEGNTLRPLILIVEPDPNITKEIKRILEFNESEVITAKNGKEALKILSELKKYPNLIISDIMMPEMDGYNFFNAISNSPTFSHIPFIFISTLDSPEDIRLGKMLGVDDYLTIPINEEDLVASIFGKLKRSKTINIIDDKISEIYLSNEIETGLIPEGFEDLMVLIEVNWDDVVGPKLVEYFPKDIKLNISIEKISDQLYDAITSIYGQGYITQAEGLLISVKNFNFMAYVFFDSYPDKTYRGGFKDFMIAFIAPKITYFQSLRIKKIFIELSTLYKKKKKWDKEEFWNKLASIITSSSFI